MRSFFTMASLLTALLLFTTADLAAQKAKKDKGPVTNPANKATKEDYTALAQYKSVEGNLLAFDPAAQTLTLKVEFPQYVPNPNYKPPIVNVNNNTANRQLSAAEKHIHQLQTKLNHLEGQITQAINANPGNARNPVQYQQHMQQHQQKVQNLMNQYQQIQGQMMQAMAQEANIQPTVTVRPQGNPATNQPFKTVTIVKEFDLEISEKALYRKETLAASNEYDDQGKPKTFTEAEKKKLKTPEGYIANPEEITVGSHVILYLSAPKKTTSAPVSTSPAKTEDATKADEKDAKEEKAKEEKAVTKDSKEDPKMTKTDSTASEPIYPGRPTVRIVYLRPSPTATNPGTISTQPAAKK